MFSGDFFLSFFLSLLHCQQHYEKTAGPICMKFSGKVWSDHGTTWLNFGSIRVYGSAGQRSICLLSPAIAQRTGVNKSVSFARWQQGAGFVVPRTTACVHSDKVTTSGVTTAPVDPAMQGAREGRGTLVVTPIFFTT